MGTKRHNPKSIVGMILHADKRAVPSHRSVCVCDPNTIAFRRWMEAKVLRCVKYAIIIICRTDTQYGGHSNRLRAPINRFDGLCRMRHGPLIGVAVQMSRPDAIMDRYNRTSIVIDHGSRPTKDQIRQKAKVTLWKILHSLRFTIPHHFWKLFSLRVAQRSTYPIVKCQRSKWILSSENSFVCSTTNATHNTEWISLVCRCRAMKWPAVTALSRTHRTRTSMLSYWHHIYVTRYTRRSSFVFAGCIEDRTEWTRVIESELERWRHAEWMGKERYRRGRGDGETFNFIMSNGGHWDFPIISLSAYYSWAMMVSSILFTGIYDRTMNFTSQ